MARLSIPMEILCRFNAVPNTAVTRYHQVGSEGQDVASTVAVDPDSGNTVVCGSTTGGLYDEKSKAFLENGLGGKDKGVEGSGTTLPFCAKLAEDGSVSLGFDSFELRLRYSV